MPLYEYRCQSCGAEEEKLEGISAPEVHACPECGARNGMKRHVSLSAFNLVGGGWYASGYSGAPEAKPAPAPKAAGGCCGGACACHGKA